MFKRLFSTAALALLTACGTTASISPPVSPTTTDIASEITAIAGIAAEPADYLSVGVKMANDRCQAFFDALAQQSNQLKLAGQEAGLAGSATTGALGVVGAGTPVTAIMGLVTPLFQQSLDNYANAQSGGVTPGPAYSLIQRAQAAYLAALATPASKTEAAMDVSGYAELCGPASVQTLVMQSIVNANPTASGPSAPTALTRPGAIEPRRLGLPIVRVK